MKYNFNKIHFKTRDQMECGNILENLSGKEIFKRKKGG